MNPPEDLGLSGDGIPVAPSMRPSLDQTKVPRITAVIDGRVAWISAIAMGLGLAAGFIAEGLVRLIGLVTYLAFYHRVSTEFASWAVALGSGTSGGTLAPLFTIGGALGALLGSLVAAAFPHIGVEPRMCALVGMAAIFAGAARCMLTSAVFAFEITLQPMGLMPLLGGCAAAYLISAIFMRHSIMTEKLARRGVRVPMEYPADHLDQLLVKDHATRPVATFTAGQTIGEARAWLVSRVPGSTHQGFPVVDESGCPVGLLMARQIHDPAQDPDQALSALITRPVAVALEGNSLREAADHMVREGVGRLPVVARDRRVVAIITRSDLLEAHALRLEVTGRD